MEKERNLNLDIIRTVAIFLVLIAHVFISIGYPGEKLRGMVDIFPLSVWIISHACIPLFLMLSGWLGKNKILSAKYYLGLIRIVGVYVLCSLVCIAFRGLYLREEISLSYVVGSIINFYACDYAWYACMYMGLFLLVPFLNLIYNGLESRRKRLVLLITLFALSTLPSLLNQFVQLYSIWWMRLFPISYYFLGAYLSDYRPGLRAGRGFALTAAVLLLFAAFDVFMYADKGNAILAITNEHYQVFFVGVLMFISLLGIETKKSSDALRRTIVKISELSYAIYILSWISDTIVYRYLADRVDDLYARCSFILPAAAVSFVMSLVMAAVMMRLFRPLERLAYKLVYRLSGCIGRKEMPI